VPSFRKRPGFLCFPSGTVGFWPGSGYGRGDDARPAGRAKLLLLFEKYELDCDRRELRRGTDLVPLEPKAFDFLAYVVQNRDRVVTKDDLIAAVWDGRIVSEAAMATCLSAARTAIGDDGEQQRLIKTLPRKGIRFVGHVREERSRALPLDGASAALLALPDKPSIAVLAFQNISSDPEQEYFADGMVEDIISGLSRIRWLPVIARNSSFAYKGRSVDIKQIGRDLGVRYVLEGSVRKAGNRVRVTAQLIEAESGVHIWAERYDRQLEDVFALQDELTLSVVGAIEPNLRKAEIERVKRKRPDSLDAYDLVLRALPITYSHVAQDTATAIPFLEKALALQPGYAAAHAALAWCHHFRFRTWLQEEDRSAAIHHARAAVVGGSDDATALAIAGFVISLDEHDQPTALNAFDQALAISNSNIFALACSALILSFMGETEIAIERAERALRLSPFDSLNYLSYNALAIAHFTHGRYDDSCAAARRSVQSNPRFSVCHLFLAAALVRLGRDQEARDEASRVMALDSGFTVQRFAVTVAIEPAVFALLADAWRAAGLPDTS
jgi:TolB-like protein